MIHGRRQLEVASHFAADVAAAAQHVKGRTGAGVDLGSVHSLNYFTGVGMCNLLVSTSRAKNVFHFVGAVSGVTYLLAVR